MKSMSSKGTLAVIEYTWEEAIRNRTAFDNLGRISVKYPAYLSRYVEIIKQHVHCIWSKAYFEKVMNGLEEENYEIDISKKKGFSPFIR